MASEGSEVTGVAAIAVAGRTKKQQPAPSFSTRFEEAKCEATITTNLFQTATTAEAVMAAAPIEAAEPERE